jgi:indolepyruvate ferredoxin oxidoreductase beta subunit
VRVYDFFRPGALEVAAILPRPLGAWLERRALRARTKGPAGHSLKLHTTSVTGTLAMRMLAALRPLRPYSLRFAREQQAIDEWLGLVERALLVANGGGVQAALGLARLPRLVKGYGDTHAGGLARFRSLVEAYHQAGGPASAAGVAALEAGAAEQSACGSPAAASAPVPQANGRPVVWLAQR